MVKNYAKIKILCYKSALYALSLFILAILQGTFFTKINVLGAVPDLLLSAVLTIAMYDDQRASAIAGIFAGFFYCAIGGFSSPLYMIFSFLCAYVFWLISKLAFAKNYPSFLLLALIIHAFKAVFNILEASLQAQKFNLIQVFVMVALPEFISSMLFCSISYFSFLLLTRVFRKKKKSRKDNSSNELKF